MKNDPLTRFFCTLVFVALSTLINAQEIKGSVPISDATKQKIDNLFKAWDGDKTPGASVAIIKDKEIVLKTAYGLANLEFKIKNTPATLFNIASNSKQFTAYAILHLAKEGKLGLEDDIRKYIPELPDFGATIKVKNLAQHTHGIRGITYLLGMAGWDIEDLISRNDVLKLLTQQQELNFLPETDFSYNNSGYMLLAEIIERTSGKPFHEYLDEIVFSPLEMTNTVLFEDYSKIIPNLSSPYFYDGNVYKKGIRNSKDIVGNTGIRTNIEDLGKWIINFENTEIGDKEVFDKLVQPTVLKTGDTLDYAFGQIVSKYKGRHVVGHGGSDAGYRSQILRFPDEKVSIIVLSNDGSLNADEKAHAIADIYLDDKNVSQSVKNGTNISKPTKAIPKETLKKYEGKFELRPGFIMEFNEKEEKLYVTATGQGTFALETLGEAQFQIRRISAVISFTEGEDGGFDSLTFDHNGQETVGTRIKYRMDVPELERYKGIYYSPELRTFYELVIENGVLLARHQRQETTSLSPLSDREFSGNTWFFGTLRFELIENTVEGFRVSSDRVQNLWFKKVKEPFEY
ncbi:serine hydrolase domain-containing protein [Poritiphilus flavus]|uniref:Serine hydrolase n=1 Tax=Poritiphilus flavus TaxID=2697053 RepID=A0A6L9EBQ2_9FLAO|nr:serine hydrolase domain-containing protein [Poritiphilus flavus]NAS12144.1 serine hydrolase [Poritiphilus flavus]